MRCIAHIVNLIVNEGLKEHNDSIARIRGAVKYVRQSPSRLQKFKECVKIEKIQSKSLLCLDVNTRWNFTYLMLDATQKFERAFERFDEMDLYFKSELVLGDVLPNNDDWKNVRRLVLFLEIFYKLTLKVSGSLYVIANRFFEKLCDIYYLLRYWQLSGDDLLGSLAKKMHEKYDKYWGSLEKMNMLLYVAIVLDSQNKLEFVNYYFNRMYASEEVEVMTKKVKEAVVELFNYYRIKLQPS